jgi:hypothetical protein
MVFRVALLLVVGFALPVAGGCGGQEAPPDVDRAGNSVAAWDTHADPGRGYAISFPGSWLRATEPMSRIDEPRELVSLGTTALSRHSTDCEAFAGSAGVSMGPGDVVITLWERGHDPEARWSDFPPRPDRFGPVPEAEPAGPGCGEPPGTMIHWRNFTDAGRHLHSLVRIGPDAPPSTATEAWTILDSLRLDPGYRPSWPGSG